MEGPLRIDRIRDQVVHRSWATATELRGRLLAARLDSLEEQFADVGTSRPVILDRADLRPLYDVVKSWFDTVGFARATDGLAALEQALRLKLTSPHAR
jgi:hypothetical protein